MKTPLLEFQISNLKSQILIGAAVISFSGCQTFPTLTHPRAGYGYYEPTPYYNPPARVRSFYPEGYYEDAGISRNDFIIATEGGF